MDNLFDFTGRKILVTGASSGIGRGTAIYLSELGATLVIHGRNEQRLKETYEALLGNGHIMIPQDLTLLDDFEGIIKEAVSDGKKLSGLVYCAGIAPVTPLKILTKKKMEMCMDINFYSFVEMVRQYAKKRHNDGGSIVGISSIFAEHPAKCQIEYSASKAAMNAAITSMAMELAKKDIRINGIMPGSVDTAMASAAVEGLGNYEHAKDVVNRQLLGVAQPVDIAKVCAFLLSEASQIITGRTMYADGGLLG